VDWTGNGLKGSLAKWLEQSADQRYVRDRRLDPFATSMRDFDDVAPNLFAIRDGRKLDINDSRQRLTDLKGAGLVDENGLSLSALGSATIAAWELYNVATDRKGDECARNLLLAIEALRLSDPTYTEYYTYWGELRTHFEPLSLLDSWDTLFAINYLDAQIDGFSPGTVYRHNHVPVTEIEFDLVDYAHSAGLSKKAIAGSERIEGALGGKIPRGRHRATFCIALEILHSGGAAAPEIFRQFGFPDKPRKWVQFSIEEKEKLSKILEDFKLVSPALRRTTVLEADEAVAIEKAMEISDQLPDLPQLSLPQEIDYSAVLKEVPKPNTSVPTGLKTTKGTPKKIDYKKKAENADTVGRLGEEFAISYEKWRLRDCPDLLKKIRHVSIDDDTLGYDIESYEVDGSFRLIEVKSTTGNLETRFFLTANELQCAEKAGSQYVILRVALLAESPVCCEVRYPFHETLELTPTIFSVNFKGNNTAA
jgi:Domain of unknown function (DUF3883)